MQEYIFMFKHVNVCRSKIEGYGLYMYYEMHLKYCQDTGIYRSIEAGNARVPVPRRLGKTHESCSPKLTDYFIQGMRIAYIIQ